MSWNLSRVLTNDNHNFFCVFPCNVKFFETALSMALRSRMGCRFDFARILPSRFRFFSLTLYLIPLGRDIRWSCSWKERTLGLWTKLHKLPCVSLTYLQRMFCFTGSWNLDTADLRGLTSCCSRQLECEVFVPWLSKHPSMLRKIPRNAFRIFVLSDSIASQEEEWIFSIKEETFDTLARFPPAKFWNGRSPQNCHFQWPSIFCVNYARW